MNRVSFLSLTVLLAACVTIREDPRQAAPAEASDPGGGGSTGTAGSSSGAGGTGAGSSSTGGTGGGGPTFTLAECGCGLNMLITLANQQANGCQTCISDIPADDPCELRRAECEANIGCDSAKTAVMNCEVVDANCLDNLDGFDPGALGLLNDWFFCVCQGDVCGGQNQCGLIDDLTECDVALTQ